MKKIDKNRITISMDNTAKNNLNEAISYFSKPENGGIKSYSGVLNQIINVFADLFIESSPTGSDFGSRVIQLKEIVPKDSQNILEKLEVVKKQNDRILYQNLVLIQKLKKNPNWMGGDLKSDSKSDDKNLSEPNLDYLELMNTYPVNIEIIINELPK